MFKLVALGEGAVFVSKREPTPDGLGPVCTCSKSMGVTSLMLLTLMCVACDDAICIGVDVDMRDCEEYEGEIREIHSNEVVGKDEKVSGHTQEIEEKHSSEVQWGDIDEVEIDEYVDEHSSKSMA